MLKTCYEENDLNVSMVFSTYLLHSLETQNFTFTSIISSESKCAMSDR